MIIIKNLFLALRCHFSFSRDRRHCDRDFNFQRDQIFKRLNFDRILKQVNFLSAKAEKVDKLKWNEIFILIGFAKKKTHRVAKQRLLLSKISKNRSYRNELNLRTHKYDNINIFISQSQKKSQSQILSEFFKRFDLKGSIFFNFVKKKFVFKRYCFLKRQEFQNSPEVNLMRGKIKFGFFYATHDLKTYSKFKPIKPFQKTLILIWQINFLFSKNKIFFRQSGNKNVTINYTPRTFQGLFF